MALGRSSIFAALSGKIPGAEAAMTKHGMVIKQRKPPRKMDSTAEMAARRTFTRWNRRWSDLTANQVKAFNAYAATHPVTDRLGSSKYISGRNLFMRLRVPLSDDYSAFTETMPPLETSEAIFDVGQIVWARGPYWLFPSKNSPNPANQVVSLWAARWQSPTTSHKPQTWIPIATFLWTAASGNLYNLFTAAGVDFIPGEHVALKWVVRAPDYWPSKSFVHFLTVQEDIVVRYECNDDRATSSVWDTKLVNAAVQYSGGAPDVTSSHAVAGHIDNALYQDGVDDYIIIPEAVYVDQLSAGTDFSISFWWKADAPDPDNPKHFFSNYDPASVGIAWLTRFDTYRSAILTNKGGHQVEDVKIWTTPVDAAWHFFAMTRKGTVVKQYLDTSETYELDEDHLDSEFALATQPLSLGARSATGHWAPGAIDDVRIYDRHLRDDEIAALAAM